MLKDGIPTKGPRNADKVVREAPSKAVIGLLFSARLANAGLRRSRGPGRLVLNSPINSIGISLWRTRLFLVLMSPSQLSTVGTPSTRGTLLSLICATSTPPTFAYRWWRVLKSSPSPSLAIWIKSPTIMCLKTKYTFATMTLMRRLS